MGLREGFGDKLAGWAAGFFGTIPLPLLFGVPAGLLLLTAVVMACLIRPIRRLMES